MKDGKILLKISVLLVILLTVIVSAFAKNTRQKKAKNPDFHFSVFALGTNHILTADAGHWGTAFLVDDEGTMVTAQHVVKDLLAVNQARKLQQPDALVYLSVSIFDLREMPKQNRSWSIAVEVVMQREDLDLAILRPMRPLSELKKSANAPPVEPLEIDNRDDLPIGEPFIVVGYPVVAPYTNDEVTQFSPSDMPALAFSQRVDPVITPAALAGYSRTLTPQTMNPKGRSETKQVFLLLDHASAPGNSGGPVISKTSGKVVGIQARTNAFGYSFAVRAADLRQLLKEFYASQHH